MTGKEFSKQSSVSLVTVYLGGPLPKYARTNLINTRKRFPNSRLVLISNHDNNRVFSEKNNISFYRFQDYKNEFSKIKEKTSHPVNFRKGFWIQTFLRFLAIADFHATCPNVEIIHFELDVILFNNFPLETFSQIANDIAFPMVTSTAGVGSVIYFRNSKSSLEMAKFFRNRITEDATSTDMTLLFNFYSQKNALVSILPIEDPNDLETPFHGIFDGATWGMFLTGTDPRNHRGWSFFHKKQISHIVNTDSRDLEIVGSLPYIQSQGGRSTPIYNLHIHSKHNRFFEQEKLMKFLQSKKNRDMKPYQKFYLAIFIKAVFDSLIRRVVSDA